MDPQHINPKNLSHRSDVTVWNGVAYVAGIIPPDNSLSIAVQTAEALAIIDGHLAAAGTDKSRLLTALIHMTDVNRDVAEFNAAWSAWLTPGRLPIRTCVEAGLQGGACIEITGTAACANGEHREVFVMQADYVIVGAGSATVYWQSVVRKPGTASYCWKRAVRTLTLISFPPAS